MTNETTILEDAKSFAELCQEHLDRQPEYERQRKEWSKKMDAWWEEKREKNNRQRDEAPCVTST